MTERQLYRVYRAGGREFPIYFEYDAEQKENYPAYPDFTERPEYTAEGRPFRTAEQECCPYGRRNDSDGLPPGDCGGCRHFQRDQTPSDPIGLCMCDNRRRDVRDEQ